MFFLGSALSNNDVCETSSENLTGVELLRREKSLEKIHTFALKKPILASASSQASLERPIPIPRTLTQLNQIAASLKKQENKRPSSACTVSHKSKDQQSDLQTSPKSKRTFYVEESFRVLSGVVLRADPILTELVSTVRQFERLQNNKKSMVSTVSNHSSQEDSSLTDEERYRLKVGFRSIEDIYALRNQQSKNDLIVRSSLGIVKQKEDWIFNLNIQNVMQQSLIGIEELELNGGVKLEPYHEIARDSMQEKVVLISVAYFCIATEMRFIAKEQSQQQQPSQTGTKSQGFQKLQTYIDSEAYHAKSVHLVSQFLPKECPLGDYIIKSYIIYSYNFTSRTKLNKGLLCFDWLYMREDYQGQKPQVSARNVVQQQKHPQQCLIILTGQQPTISVTAVKQAEQKTTMQQLSRRMPVLQKQTNKLGTGRIGTQHQRVPSGVLEEAKSSIYQRTTSSFFYLYLNNLEMLFQIVCLSRLTIEGGVSSFVQPQTTRNSMMPTIMGGTKQIVPPSPIGVGAQSKKGTFSFPQAFKLPQKGSRQT